MNDENGEQCERILAEMRADRERKEPELSYDEIVAHLESLLAMNEQMQRDIDRVSSRLQILEARLNKPYVRGLLRR